MKKLTVILLLTVLFTICAFANEYDFEYVYDDAWLFTNVEEAKIVKEAENVFENNNVLFVVVTGYDLSDLLDELPEYASDAEDMILLSIDMESGIMDMYQYTTGEKYKISDAEKDDIFDGMYDDMHAENYCDAALTFISMTLDAYTNSEIAADSDYVDEQYYSEKEKEFGIGSVILPLVIGLAVGGITVFFVKMSYKQKVHGSIYPLSKYSSLNLTASNDNFVNKTVIVTRIQDPPSNSGGGGRSGGAKGVRMGGRSFK